MIQMCGLALSNTFAIIAHRENSYSVFDLDPAPSL